MRFSAIFIIYVNVENYWFLQNFKNRTFRQTRKRLCLLFYCAQVFYANVTQPFYKRRNICQSFTEKLTKMFIRIPIKIKHCRPSTNFRFLQNFRLLNLGNNLRVISKSARKFKLVSTVHNEYILLLKRTCLPSEYCHLLDAYGIYM